MAEEKTLPDEIKQQQAREAVLRAAGVEVKSDVNSEVEEKTKLASELAAKRRLEAQGYADNFVKQAESINEALDEVANKENNTEAQPVEPQPHAAEKSEEKPKKNSSPTPKKYDKEIKDVVDGEGGNMSLINHLIELRIRIIRSLIGIGVGMLIAYLFLDDIVTFFTAPAGTLHVIKPMEAFTTYLKIDIFAGFIIAMPIVFYQIWSFFLPGLKRKEKMVLGLLVPLSVILFLGGMAFAFIIILPLAIKFLLGVGTDFNPMLSAGDYFEFVLKFLLPFGLVFELPLVMVVLAKLNLVTSRFLLDKFRYLIFISFVVGAIITPPDVISQVMLALPIIVLYGISLFIIKFIMRK